MFEAAEVGRKLSGKEFDALEDELRTELLAAQFRARDRGTAIVVLVSGVEGAGKGEVVDRLNKWLDTRGTTVRAFWDETDEERERPAWWRFWRAMPAAGEIAVMFGSWYTRPIADHALGRTTVAEFDRQLRRIETTERMLTDDGMLIVKLWFHLDGKAQQSRLREDFRNRGEKPKKVASLLEAFADAREGFLNAAERALRLTDRGHAPWHVIEAGDARYRDFRAGQLLLDMMRSHEQLEPGAGTALLAPDAEVAAPPLPDAQRTVLDCVDLDVSTSRKEYDERLAELQARLHELGWRMRAQRGNVVGVFEGWDAAGKGGAIRRLTAAIDARLYRTISVSAPTDEELAHHYLWRFWRHVPMRGNMTLYDRSWYGRVLVERVEGLAAENEWRRAYLEINEFEEQLAHHGVLLLKFWLHVSPEEQLERFRERERTPWKAHKITEEDWRNREQWRHYEIAVNEMVARTSTEHAPWTLVPGNCKRTARLTVLEAFRARLEAAFG